MHKEWMKRNKGTSIKNCRVRSFAKNDVSEHIKVRQSQILMSQKTFRLFPPFAKTSVVLFENLCYHQRTKYLQFDWSMKLQYIVYI